MTTPQTAMRDRAAGELVIEQLLDLQSDVQPRSLLARFLGANPLSDDTTSWYQGALGEIAVGRLLATLPAGWTVFHALPVGSKDSDIDHLVVGPGGIFTISTKHHADKVIWVAGTTFLVSRHRQPHLRNSLHEAERVSQLLSGRMPPITVQPMIVLVDPKRITIALAPDVVEVIDARRLVDSLVRRPSMLAPDDAASVVAQLDDPATWRASAASSPDLMLRFERLHRAVRSARTRRRVWGLGSVTFGAALVVALVLGLPYLMIGFF